METQIPILVTTFSSVMSLCMRFLLGFIYFGGLSGRFKASQIPTRYMASNLTVSFSLLKPEIRIYLIEGVICSLLLVSLSVGEAILCRVGISLKSWDCCLCLVLAVIVSSFQPKLVIWVRLCDIFSLWRYLLDLSLVLYGYG